MPTQRPNPVPDPASADLSAGRSSVLSPARLVAHFVSTYRRIPAMRWLMLGVAAGLLSGTAAIAFYALIEWAQHVCLGLLAGLSLPAPAGERLFHSAPGPYRPWLIPLMLAGVGLLTGWLVRRHAPESVDSGTDGTDAMIKAFHRQNGVVRPVVALIRGAGAALTIGAGGSAGREGPISLIGACIGSWLAERLKLSAKERRILLLAGAAGGLGAIFRAPLGGALTAVEVIYREDFEAEAVLPSVLASVTSYSLFALVYGAQPILSAPAFHFGDVRELLFYAVLAVVCALSGRAYLATFFFIKRKIFARLRTRAGIVWTPVVGGLAMGFLGWAWPETLSGGYGWLEQAIDGQTTLAAMALMLVGKTVATSLTIGSGLSGGMFAPALFVGGMSGGLVGYAAHAWAPLVAQQPGGYVLVGMASFFAGVSGAAIGPILMVCEITQGYGLLAPLMLSSALSMVLNRNVSLYENQLENKFRSPAHADDIAVNVLEDLRVESHYRKGRVVILEEGVTLRALTDIIVHTSETCFPVRNDKGELTGLLDLRDVRRVLFEDALFELIVARDLASPPAWLHPDDDLYQALLKFAETGHDQLPVVAREEPGQILGLLDRDQVFRAYSRAVKDEGWLVARGAA